MPYLDLYKNGRKSREVPIDGEVVIGRGAGATLKLEGTLISREHARIHSEAGAWRLEDLQTKNGTFVNGNREFACELRDGDQIQIDDWVLVFQRPAHEHAPHARPKFQTRREVETQASRTRRVAPGAYELDADDKGEATRVVRQIGVENRLKVDPSATRVADPKDIVKRRKGALAKLGTHLVGPTGAVYPLTKEHTLIGSDKREVDVPIAGASRLGTARVSRRKDGTHVIKWRGLFGSILVDGKKRRQQVLKGGERIVIHGHEFVFQKGEGKKP